MESKTIVFDELPGVTFTCTRGGEGVPDHYIQVVATNDETDQQLMGAGFAGPGQA